MFALLHGFSKCRVRQLLPIVSALLLCWEFIGPLFPKIRIRTMTREAKKIGQRAGACALHVGGSDFIASTRRFLRSIRNCTQS